MKRKNTLAHMLVAALFSWTASGVAQTSIDFTNATCYGISSSQVMVENVRLQVPVANPFDPGSTTLMNMSYNVPFDFDASTLHLVPALAIITQTDDGTGSSSSNCAALQVRVADAYTGSAISGATVSVGGQSTTTDSNGLANLTGVTAGLAHVSVVAANYTSTAQTTSSLSCTTTNSTSIALSPQSGTGALTSGEFRVVLTWGENPYDLDSHLTGPASDGTTRFHVYYSSKTHDVASLDVDDTSSYGPETVTVSPSSGSTTLRPGIYRYSVHHYSGSNTIGTSGASVRLTLANGTIYTYTPSSALSFSGYKDVWTVFELTVDNSGMMYIAPVDSVYNESSASSVRSAGKALKSHSGYGRPEDMSLFRYTK